MGRPPSGHVGRSGQGEKAGGQVGQLRVVENSGQLEELGKVGVEGYVGLLKQSGQVGQLGQVGHSGQAGHVRSDRVPL